MDRSNIPGLAQPVTISSPKLLYLVTEDWYFCSHRLSLALAARDAGYEVIVATRVGQAGRAIEAAGLRLVPLRHLRRGSANVLFEFAAINEIVRLYRRERPDLVHHVALKPVVHGSIAARLAGVSRAVNTLAGLGFVFSSSSFKARRLRSVVAALLKHLLDSPGSRVILQNPDDALQLAETGIVSAERVRLVRGSGVNLKQFRPTPGPDDQPPRVVLASRMLWDKGVGEFVRAAEILKARGIVARFVLVGGEDSENPAGIPRERLQQWQADGRVEWWGHRTDMTTVLQEAHIVCLPSYREGLPKVLLEAAACGRPLVTTDVPGCREVVVHGENGLLIPARNAQALADALVTLIEDPAMRTHMGDAGRRRVEALFGERMIIEQTLTVYQELIRP